VATAGDAELTEVVITDPLAGLSAITCDTPAPATLLPNTTLTCHATYVVTQHDLDTGQVRNTARATGLAPDDSEVEATDSVEVTSSATKLPTTGFTIVVMLRWMLVALVVGSLLIAAARRRRQA
jgi:hypothetical protein